MRLYKNQYFPSDISMPVNAPDELQNPKILQMNRLTPRATIIPAQKSGVYYYNKEESDRIFSLNGEYRFALFSDNAPNDFESPEFNVSDWEAINVPSMWQYLGYGEPTYPNIRAPFPFCPPYVLRLNPVGCYKRTFTPPPQRPKERTILHFEGVDNAFYVYLNGTFVGFSKGSRLPAEFDVTDLLLDGENDLSVKVYTYSDSTYLENQDMLMANGIFRDVYLMFMPKTSLWDWEIITDTETLTLTATLQSKTEQAKARITFNEETITLPFCNGVLTHTFNPNDILLWSAEMPNLYNLTLELLSGETVCEVHNKRVGFTKSEVVGREFHVNGKKVIMRGINRHENNPKTGRYLTVEQTRADLELIKSHNINAIRCAHYPNTPAFYEFASELGIYVMDECDLESHGASVTGDQGYLNKDPEWLDAFMDRIVRMAERDKNETCVTLWSVGNEIGAGQNADICAEYLKKRTDKKPVQVHAMNKSDQDIIYCGYPSLLKLDNFRNDNINSGKPLMLLEYAHAMGNGPGNQQNLWDYIIEHPEFIGGYVWEFRSHGLERVNANGSIDYLYGGDFHDTNHWGHFTLDGFCTSDGTPKPTFLELKYVFTPVRLDYKDGKLLIHNIQSFSSTKGLILEKEILCDGEVVFSSTEKAPIVEPMSKAEFKLPLSYNGHDCFLNLKLYDGENIISLKQVELPSTAPKLPFKPSEMQAEVITDMDKVTVLGKRFEVRFANGVPTYYKKDNNLYFDSPMQHITYRAETDNDGIRKIFPRWIGAWENTRLTKLRFYCFKTEVTKNTKDVTIHTVGKLIYDAVSTGFDVITDYKIYTDGLLTFDMTVKPFGEMPCIVYDTPDPIDPLTPRLPRFGVCFKLSKDYNEVTWFGRGIDHNYEDSISAAPVGIYSLPLNEMNFEYDVPQETGNRGDTRYAQIKAKNNAFTVYGNECFSFSYHPWKLDVLRNAMHKSEIYEDTENNYLYIDYKMRALGSHSCGPNPERELDFEPHDFQFVFAINGEDTEKPEYFLTDFGPKTKKLTEIYTYVPLTSEREAVECEQK